MQVVSAKGEELIAAMRELDELRANRRNHDRN
jgi:hypothetical protein